MGEVIAELNQKPVVIGHSFGGLLTQIVAGRGLSRTSVAIDPGPFRGVLPLPFSALKAASPVIANPLNRGRAVPLTLGQFRFAFANAVSEDEAKDLYESYAVPGSGVPLFQAAFANINPWTEAKVNWRTPRSRATAHHRRRERQHPSAQHGEGCVQAAEKELWGDGVRSSPEPWPLVSH